MNERTRDWDDVHRWGVHQAGSGAARQRLAPALVQPTPAGTSRAAAASARVSQRPSRGALQMPPLWTYSRSLGLDEGAASGVHLQAAGMA